MAVKCTAYRDSRDGLHASAERATLSDLALVLGRVGEDGGLTMGVARMIFDKREDLERVFAEHDAMVMEVDSAELDAEESQVVGLPR